MPGSEVEIVERHEIVVDEDVLSFEARAALDQVGSATGFILALALLFAMVPRAARLGAFMNARSEGRTARDEERRMHDVSIRERPSNV